MKLQKKITSNKSLLILTLIFAIFIGIIFRLLTPQAKIFTPKLAYPNHLTTYRDIAPGSTSVDAFIENYGSPLPSTSQYVATTSSDTYYFRAQKEHLPTEVKTSPNDTIELIKEKWTPPSSHGQISQYFQSLDAPDLELYGPWYRSGHKSFVWLEEGLIVIANPNLEGHNIMQIWRTPPFASVEEFNLLLGDQFSTTQPVANFE